MRYLTTTQMRVDIRTDGYEAKDLVTLFKIRVVRIFDDSRKIIFCNERSPGDEVGKHAHQFISTARDIRKPVSRKAGQRTQDSTPLPVP